MRSAGFEPAIPSLGSSYLDRAGLTSLRITINITKESLYILNVLNSVKTRVRENYSTIIIHY